MEADAASGSTEKNENAGLSGRVNWVKIKKDALDMEVVLENHYAFPVHFNSGGWKMTVNNIAGDFHFQKFSGNMGPGSSDRALVSFDFKGSGKKLSGPAILTLDHVYAENSKQKIAPLVIKFNVNQ